MESIVVIVTMSVLIMVSPFLSRLTKIPVAVVEILLGSIAALLGLFGSAENGLLPLLAKVGFLYLMFLAGMEVNLREFGRIGNTLMRRAIAYFVIMYALAFFITLSLDLSPIYIAALPIVSLGMIMALINEYGRNEPWLNLALTIGIIGELISIAALTILSGTVQYGWGWEFARIMMTLLGFLLVVVAFFKGVKVLFWWFPEIKRLIMPDDNRQDQDVRVSIALFFVLVAAMLYLGLEVVLGAFVAGMFIASFFEHKAELPEKLSSFGFGFLVPIFFIYVGSTFELWALFDPQVLSLALWMVVAMVAIRLVSSLVYLRFLGLRNTLLFGLGDSMPLSFLVAIATIGYGGGLLSQSEYFAFILASMIQAVGIMLLIQIIYTLTGKTAPNRPLKLH